MREDDAEFLLGLLAGEGTFTFQLKLQDGRMYARPVAQIAMYDESLIAELDKRTPFGSVNLGGTPPAWRCEKKASNQLIEVVDKYPQEAHLLLPKSISRISAGGTCRNQCRRRERP